MPITSLVELREALRTATPGDTIDLAPGEYNGPLIISIPVTLRGLDRRTVLWRRGGPVIYVRTPGVTLDKLLIERTVDAEGPLIVHDTGCAPTGRESMTLDALINLGDLVPGSTIKLPLDVEVAARTELSVTGLYGAQVSPAVIETPGSHLIWLTVDGKAIQRGEVLLGEITLREGDSTRYIWLSGSSLDSVPADTVFCLSSRKTKLYPSPTGLMLDAPQLSIVEGGQSVKGRCAFVQKDPTGHLFLYLPGEPASPVLLNGHPVARWTRTLLREKDTIKIADASLSVQRGETPPVTVEPSLVSFVDFSDHFPEQTVLLLHNGKTAWKGRLVPVADWLEVSPSGDFRVPPSRTHSWGVQLTSAALALPNGVHEVFGGLMVVGPNHVIAADVRLNVARPEVALRIEPVDAGSVEWGWPVERIINIPIGNLGRGTWTGEVKSNVPWLEVIPAMPVSCGPWSEVVVQAQFVPAWETLPPGRHALTDALSVEGQPVPVTLEVTPAQGHLTLVDPVVVFDQVERDAPLPDATLTVRNEGGAPWTGTVRATNGWVRVSPDEITVEPGAEAEIQVSLLDVPADLALDTPVLVDEIQLGTTESLSVNVQITVVELPPFLVAQTVNFPPFVKGDNPPEGVLRIHNNGPARWRGTVVSNLPWLNAPDNGFTCEAGDSIDMHMTLNNKAAGVLQIGFNQWDDALSVTGGREPVSVPVQIDLRDTISELHLETPILNFGQVDSGELSSQAMRLVNASPSPWIGRVELCVPWLSTQGHARAFDLEVPGSSIAEFKVSLNDSARRLSPGIITENQALLITGKDQRLTVRALLVVNESAPILAITPEKVELKNGEPQKIKVRNGGQREWTVQVNAAPWLQVSPAELTLGPSQEQEIEVKRLLPEPSPETPAPLSDPRAVVIAGPGREYEVEVSA